MKRILSLSLFVLLALPPAWALNWTSMPSSPVASGTGYTVGAYHGEYFNSYGSVSLQLYKNGAYVTGASNGGSGFVSAPVSYGANDSGTQTINYQCNASVDGPNGHQSYSISGSVSIYNPNSAPTISWSNNPGSAYVNQWFNVQAHGHDVNGNLATVYVWHNEQPFAFNGGGNGTDGYSDNNAAVGTVPGTEAFKARATDSAGADSGYIYLNVSIVDRAPSSPTISTGGVTQINLGQSLSLSGTLYDADGNLAYHNLYYAAPGGGWIGILDGTPSNPTSSYLSTTYTPTVTGTWQFKSDGHDGYAWSPGAALSVAVVDATPPSVPTGLAVTANTTGTSFTLNWTDSTDNVGVTAYEVMRDTTSLAEAAGATRAVTGLAQATTYAMKVRARDAAGNYSAWSAVLNVTTPDVTAPSVPTGLSVAGNTTGASFTLNWTASTDNVGVTAYEVMRDTTSLAEAAGATRAVTGLAQVTTYAMKVRARDAAGNYSAWSSVLNVTTPDVTAPSVPAALSVTGNTTGTSFTLNWTASTDNVGVTAYEVMRGTTSQGEAAGATRAIAGLAQATTYAMKVRARDAAGNYSAWSAVLNVTTPDVTAPSVPTGLSVTGNTTGTSFTLRWTASTDNVGVTAYEVMRGTTSQGEAAGATRAISGLTQVTTYAMKVRARDAAGNYSAWSGVLNVTTPDVTAPSVPTGLAAASVTATSFTLNWTASTDNVAVTTYEVMRDTTSLGSGAGATRAVTGLSELTTYAMKVRARDAAGNWSAWSPGLNVSTGDGSPPAAPTHLAASVISTNSFTLSWDASSDNVAVAAYEVRRDTTTLTPEVAGTTLSLGGLNSSTSYAMTVRARDAVGNWSAWSTPLAVATANALPGVTLTAPVAGATFAAPATVALAAAATDSDGTVAKVEFFQDGVKIGESTAAPFTFSTTLVYPGSYGFKARATDNAGDFMESATTSVIVNEVPTALPFSAGFESSENYALGPVSAQRGWTATGATVVTDAAAAAGLWSTVLPGAATPLVLSHAFPTHDDHPVVFVDASVLLHAAATEDTGPGIATLKAAKAAFMKDGATGRFRVWQGDGLGGGAWQDARGTVMLDSGDFSAAWQHVTLRLDYTARKWDLYVNGALAAVDVVFTDSTQATLGSFTLTGDPAQPTQLDSFSVGFTNPLFADTDLDGMPDAWETAHHLNPNVNDRDGDYDQDGVTNINEYLNGTDPDNADTDGDGLSDADEINLYHTNPALADTDGDGMPDGWEIAHGLDPKSALDGALDADHDGMSNAAEYAAGRDPHNALDKSTLPTGYQAVLPTAGGQYMGLKTATWTLTPVVP